MILKNDDVEYFSEDIADEVEKGLGTPNYEVNSPLSTEKNKKVIGLMKDELGGKIMTEFAALTKELFLLNG